LKRKIFSILFAVVLVLSLSLVTAVPAMAATTYHVATTGNNANTGGESDPWLTIQHAVGQAISSDTIIVHAGTYTESVSITTDDITLKTDGAVIVDPPDGANKSCFKVRADGVTIRGFELTGAVGSGSYGIDFQGSHNIFTNNVIHDLAGFTTGGGIVSWDYNGGTDNNTISNNEIYNIPANGILIGACTPSAVNTGNVIKNNTISASGTWHPGIEVVNGHEFTIVRNSVSGYTGWPQYYGISVDAWNGEPQGGHNISHNTVEGYYYGILLMADTGETGFGGVIHGYSVPSSVALDDNIISHNEVHHNLYHGIVLRIVSLSVPATVSNNAISHNDAHDNTTYHGIYVMAGANYNTIDHNDALNNGYDGIKVAGGNNSIHHNTATGNGNYDLEDLGTGNTWFKNTYGTSNPSGL